MPAIKNSNTIAEYDAIVKVVKYYIQGLKTIPSSITFETIKFKMLRKSNASLVFVLLLFLTFVNSSQSLAQCAMCSINAEQGAKNGNTITQGINTGVLILLGTVYFLMSGLAILWYKKFRKKSMKEVNNLFPASSGYDERLDLLRIEVNPETNIKPIPRLNYRVESN